MKKLLAISALLVLFFSLPASAQYPPEFVEKMNQCFNSIDRQIKEQSQYEAVGKKALAKLGEGKKIICSFQISDLRGGLAYLAVKATGSRDLDQSILSLVRSATPFHLKTVEAQNLRFCPQFVTLDFDTTSTGMTVSARQGHGAYSDEDCWIQESPH